MQTCFKVELNYSVKVLAESSTDAQLRAIELIEKNPKGAVLLDTQAMEENP